ncbi:hypothetical protein A3H84_03575 [Candidatus Roizmanbacteria bacterium RIFCSPLOWO2_02_FULL_40_13]|nr:MAG: hypothetical protein A3H84_03575 [Candidatus Roizmanbacteria bacterium RIFCSPLOWO2_02_FULL_40_13]
MQERYRGRIQERLTYRFDGIQQSYVHSVVRAFKENGAELEVSYPAEHKHEPVFGSPFIHITVDGPHVRSFIHLVNRMARVQRGESTLEGFDLNAKVATTVRLAQRRLESQRVSTSG